MDLLETRVVHKNREPFDVDIGRGGPFGNPFTHRPSVMLKVIYVGSRLAAIERYRSWLTSDEVLPGWTKPTMEQILSLEGKRLGCVCVPLPCHGQVLVDLIARWRTEQS